MQAHARRVAVLALGLSWCVLGVAAAPTTPAYLSGLPSPARIVAEIKGKDPEDTIERQMGAFQALIKMIDDVAWGLEKRYGRPTPDEAKLQHDYGVAYAELWHKATNNEAHTYDHDRTLRDELLGRFVSEEFRTAYFAGDAKAAANAKAQFQKNFGDGNGHFAPAASASAGKPAGDDFDTLCAAKGLDGFTCMMQGMMTGVMKVTDAVQGPPVPGLRMSGWYQAGTFKMILDQGPSAWVNCDESFLLSNYTVSQQNGRTLIRVANGDTPFVVMLADDGTTLVGPPTVVVHGRAPGAGAGASGGGSVTTPGSSQQVTTTTQRTLTPMEAQQYPNAVQNGQTYTLNETTTSTEYTPAVSSPTPVYHPKTGNCRFGSITPAPARPAGPPKKPQGMSEYLQGMIPSGPFVPNGLRMIGRYDGQAGASIDFQPDQAVVECHATLEEHPYTVAAQPAGGFRIHLSGAVPVDFVLGPDGTIRGDATVRRIAGHRKVGENTLGDPTYAPSADACGYASLAPRLPAAAGR